MYNEFTISGIFDILQKLIQVLSLSKKIVYNKIIILKDDLLTIRNVMQVIYKRQDKLTSFY